ncbi:glycosyltransferase family 4 protein [Dictyobacter arantiisoli]|uniref:Glycosyl transferase family 1 n=1 Tax=Dictyobacter arantiisoli TaxID=2014874 RepID=A0A5A5TBL2_9CHLR|nr:glycosyltransferase family 1 protein [Dictyobacter arantiisoli]GCF08546.1 glycosyl transferase family 1 [Dictyobacter arantiisoli]
MKIGVNAHFFQFPATGSGQYLIHLLKALAEVDHHNQYVLLGPQPLAHPPVTEYPYLARPVPAPAAKSENIEKVLWEQFSGPLAARREKVDLYHIPHFAPPLFPLTPTVVTIHDVIPLRLPAYQASGKIKAYNNLVARAARHTTRIITPSQHAKQDIIDALHIPAERIDVIYEAAGQEYQPVTDPARIATAQARYGIGERYVFYLGGLDQRKNVLQLIRAFAHLTAQLNDPTLQLLIAGNPDLKKGPLFPDPRPLARELGISERIVYHFIEEEDKPALYSGASVFVFPSLYEGFGLDPLEAMGCGAPVVCSNRTSLPEVVGDAALQIDPDNTEALAAAMYSVLTNPELRADLCARSLQQARRFDWVRAAQQTLAVYETVLAQRKK